MKILLIQDKKNAALGTAIFALNPVILFETLVSAHNDISMMAFAMMSVYYFMVNKKTLSYLLLALSVGAKLMTVFLYPVIAFGFRKFWALAAMSLGLVLVLFQREFLPWYFVWIVPFVALIPESGLLVTVASGISAGLLLRYAPYFYYGNFGNPVPLLQFWVTVVPIALSLAGYLFYRLLNRRKLTS